MRIGSAETFIRRVVARPLPGRLLSEVAPLLAGMRYGNPELAYSDEVIEAATRPDARVPRLRTVDDAQRFRRAHEVEAYLGLVPPES